MAEAILIYLLKVIICSGVFVLYYWLTLRNNRFHYYNRFYILTSVAASALLPLLHFEFFSFSSNSSQTIHLFNIISANGGEDFNASKQPSVSLQTIMFSVGACITVIMLIAFGFSIIKIYRLKRKYPVNKLNEFDFIQTDIRQAPFSFFKNIFWRTDISLNDETGKQILQHEITHIKQKHSWDKLFIETMLCFYWMNPFYWLLKNELYLLHEFIADEEAIGKKDGAAFAKMLLASQYGKFQFLPAQSIFFSPIKRRLIMLTTSKKPQFSYLRRMMILPLLAIVICLFSFTIKNAGNNSAVKTSAPFTLVVDAGHGGKDNGVVSNGLTEKDIALKIAEKIKELSSQYGVDVILTRSSDVFMSPQEKSNFANSQNANAFVSIHVNSSPGNQTLNSGMEIVLSKKNEKYLNNNQVLGSAILQSLSTDFKTEQVLNQQQVGVWVLDNSNIPSALIECGYITNADDAKTLSDDSKIELIAKNILQGVAMYANNSFDKSKLYEPENSNAKDTNAPIQLQLKEANKPLYVLGGKIIKEEEFKNISPNDIESMYVLKDKDATDKYGDKGKYGVIEITMKSDKEKRETKEPVPPPPPPAPPVKPHSVKLTLKDTLSISVATDISVKSPVVIIDTLDIKPVKAHPVN